MNLEIFPVCPDCFVDEMDWNKEDFADAEVITHVSSELVAEAPDTENDPNSVSCG
jgi:hypothetical protein